MDEVAAPADVGDFVRLPEAVVHELLGFLRGSELAPLLPVLRALPFLAGAIPLVAAILMVSASPRSFSDGEYEAFRLLTTMLIALGMAGFQLAVTATGMARRSIDGFVGKAVTVLCLVVAGGTR